MKLSYVLVAFAATHALPAASFPNGDTASAATSSRVADAEVIPDDYPAGERASSSNIYDPIQISNPKAPAHSFCGRVRGQTRWKYFT
jgi:hypothetical protein